VPLSKVFPRDWIIRCTEQSLKHLSTECIDLQQLHVWSPHWLKEPEWYETLRDVRAQGKVRFIGVSINDHEPDTALDLIRSGWVDTLQVIYNIFDQSPSQNLFPLAQQYNIGILARCPLDEGSLSGHLRTDTVFPQNDWRHDYFRGDRLRETVERVQRLIFLIRDEIQTLSQAALKFCLSHPAVSTVIPGMRRISHVEENCLVSDGKLLTLEELEQLRAHQWSRNFYN
ncbi:MAG TPA: aldo/keto reductase, partial [Nitrospiria bacterium]|nr:aldo/keto reductase [Nitrospiria bacterium]